MIEAYCTKINSVWYCVVTDGYGNIRAVQFSLKTMKDALNLAAETIPDVQVRLQIQIPRQIKTALEALSDLFEGKEPKHMIEVSYEGLPSFTVQALKATARIPRGFVSTYRLLAGATGKPSAVRAAGNAMARNPFPLIIPCHRVVKSNLTLGNYGGGVEVKRMLLEKEGVHIEKKGKSKYSVSEKFLHDFDS